MTIGVLLFVFEASVAGGVASTFLLALGALAVCLCYRAITRVRFWSELYGKGAISLDQEDRSALGRMAIGSLPIIYQILWKKRLLSYLARRDPVWETAETDGLQSVVLTATSRYWVNLFLVGFITFVFGEALLVSLGASPGWNAGAITTLVIVGFVTVTTLM